MTGFNPENPWGLKTVAVEPDDFISDLPASSISPAAEIPPIEKWLDIPTVPEEAFIINVDSPNNIDVADVSEGKKVFTARAESQKPPQAIHYPGTFEASSPTAYSSAVPDPEQESYGERFDRYLREADQKLTIAAEVEISASLEEAAEMYEAAMNRYLGALGMTPGQELEEDIGFWLKLGSATAKSAPSAKPYSEKIAYPLKDDDGNLVHIRGLSRRDDLFYSANNCFRRAWEIAGGVDAPVEVITPIVTEQAELHILSGEPEKALDVLVGVADSLPNDTDPEIVRLFKEQITDTELIIGGQKPTDAQTATHLLVELAAA
jgi:hypothetical protein